MAPPSEDPPCRAPPAGQAWPVLRGLIPRVVTQGRAPGPRAAAVPRPLGSAEEPQCKGAASALDFLQTSTVVPLVPALFSPPELGGRDLPWALDWRQPSTAKEAQSDTADAAAGRCALFQERCPLPPRRYPSLRPLVFPGLGTSLGCNPGKCLSPQRPPELCAKAEGARGWISLARGPPPESQQLGELDRLQHILGTPISGSSPDPSSSQDAPGMDWLRGLERGWEIHLWRLLRAQLQALGPLGKASGCRLPPALDTGEAVAGPEGRWRGGAEGGSRAQSLLRSLLRGSRAQGLVLGPPEAALGWRERARSPGGTGEPQPLLMETPAAPCCSGRGHGLGRWVPVCSGRAQGCLVPACLVLRLCRVARE
ncbi:uncharacterized protein LOC112116435 [Terrapene carolina triunguis]|uniref:uncharacterized protein LOC112116435 n=1 Tax=Terrapene triunguis TaxID=2587831 RepID=UPI000E7771F0|nr:uncharacterized protein LOC112116435 [Terrapene carolina triunguis]